MLVENIFSAFAARKSSFMTETVICNLKVKT